MKYFKMPIKMKILLSLFFVGFIIGIVTANQSKVAMPILDYDNVSKIKIFINTFTLTIWDLFIVWCLGYNVIGIFLILIIVFLKGYVEGNSLIWLLNLNYNFTSINIISFVLYWLIMIPLFFWLTNSVVKIDMSYNDQKPKKMMMVLIVNVFYSLILALIN